MADSNSIDYTLRVTADSQAGSQQFSQDVANASKTAQSSVDQLTATIQRQNAAMSQMAQPSAAATSALNMNSAAARQLQNDLANLTAKLDPVAAATQRLAAQTDILSQAHTAGLLSTAEFTAMQATANAALGDAEHAATRASTGLTALGMSSSQTLVHLRALGDEAASGRWKQFDGSLLNVIAHIAQANPEFVSAAVSIGLGVTAFGLAALAADQYSSSLQALNAQMALHNNNLGFTGDAANAAGIAAASEGNMSRSQGRSLIAAGTGTSLSGEQVTQVAGISKDMAEAADMTGGAAQAFKQFATALDDPIKAMQAMEKEYNNVTTADDELVRELVAAGNPLGARQVLIDDMTKSMQAYHAANQTVLGSLGSAIVETTSNAWDTFGDTMLKVFSGGTAGSGQLADAQKGLADAQSGVLDGTIMVDGEYASHNQIVQMARDYVEKLNDEMAKTPAGMDAIAQHAAQTSQSLVNFAQAAYLAANPTLQRQNALTAQANTINAGLNSGGDMDPQTRFNEQQTADRLTRQASALKDPITQALDDAHAKATINAIKDPQARAAAQAKYSATNQGQQLGMNGIELSQFVSDSTSAASERRAPKPKTNHQRDLTKGFDQQNTDQQNLAGAYDSGDASTIAYQQAQNEALEKTSYNTKTNVDALTQSILQQKAALALAQGAAADYNENLKLVATTNLTQGYEAGGVRGQQDAAVGNDANTQFDSKIAAAQAAKNQSDVAALEIAKQKYTQDALNINQQQRQLSLDQMSQSNDDKTASLQQQISGIGMTAQAQADWNAQLTVTQQLQQKGLTTSDASYAAEYQHMLAQYQQQDALNQQLKDAQTAQANYKDEIDQFGSSFEQAFEGAILGGNSLKQTFATLLEAIAKTIFEMEVMKPLMDDINKSASGSGGVFQKLLGLIGGGSSAGAGAVGTGFSGVGPMGFGSAAISHAGDIAGMNSTFRSVDMGLFSGAKRYHSGGIVDGEVPIIAQQNEAVMPTVRMSDGSLGIKTTGGGGGGGVVVSVPVTLNVNYQGSSGSGAGSNGDMTDFSNKMADNLGNVMDQRIGTWAANETRPGGILSGTQRNRMGG
jgi:hypothetical protein